MTDEEIVARCRDGDTGRFVELVRRHKEAVYAVALRFTRECAEAEDVTQEVFLRAYRNLNGFRGGAKVSTWLYRIARNCCIDWARAKARARARTAEVEDLDILPDHAVDVEASLEKSEERERVRRALGRLDEEYRSVLVLYYEQGLSYDEVAAALGCPQRTVETRLYRARKLLRRYLREGGEHEMPAR